MSDKSLVDPELATTGLADVAARPTWVRYQVLAAACSLAVITYIHRVGFARASAQFKESQGLDDRQLGWIMAAFMIGYGIFEIPWGHLGDRLGARNVLAAIILGGSILTAGTALVAVLPPQITVILVVLMVLRFLFGAFQAGTFPTISRMMADWMPATERGQAQGAIWMSARMGGALAPLLVGWMIAKMRDWQQPLLIVSGLGLAWCAAFWPWFRNRPEEMPQVNESERKIIRAGRDGSMAHGHGSVPWAKMGGSSSVWALCMMYGFLGFSGNFYITLLPSYLKNHRHLGDSAINWLTSLPFAFGVLGCLIGGWVSDAIIRRWGTRWGRRLVGAIGMVAAGLCILAIPWVEDTMTLGVLLTVTYFGNDLAMAPSWAAAGDIGGRYTGVLSGAMNMVSSFMAALDAIFLGRLLSADMFVLPFVILACSYGLGALAWFAVDVRMTLAEGH
jgi:sugar phosphate permease